MRSAITARLPEAADEAAANAVERALEARERARTAQEERETGLAQWQAHKAEERLARRRQQTVDIARRLSDRIGVVRERHDGRPEVIRRLATIGAPDEDLRAALEDVYGSAVADAFFDGGVEAAVEALPEPW